MRSGQYLTHVQSYVTRDVAAIYTAILANKAESAVHGCHCPGDMAVCLCKVLADRGLVFKCVTCF